MSKNMIFNILVSLLIFKAKCSIINLSVEKEVDIQSQLVKITNKIVFMYRGGDRIHNYSILLNRDVQHYFIKFTDVTNTTWYHQESEVVFKNGVEAREVTGFCVNAFTINRPVALLIEQVLTNRLKLVHKTKKFNEPDLVRYCDNLFLYSPYPTLLTKVSYVLQDRDAVISVDGAVTTNTSFNLENVDPLAVSDITIVFRMDAPQIVVTSLERIIDVTAYGMISVSEVVAMKNVGAKVVGPYQPPKQKLWHHTHLPASATDIQLFDEIGKLYNIAIETFTDYITLHFRGRYPLLGGWKTTYTLQYVVPSYEYLYRLGESHYRLQMRVFDHVLNDVPIENFTTKIVLPEYAAVTYNFIPTSFEHLADETSVTLLSCFGRQTVVMRGAQVTEYHIQDFVVNYTYKSVYFLRVPAKLSIYCFIVFFIVIVLKRSKQFVTL